MYRDKGMNQAKGMISPEPAFSLNFITMQSLCTVSKILKSVHHAYQEGCDDGEEGAEAQHNGISDALIQQRLASKETCVSRTHPIHHGVVLACPWQPRWACRRHLNPVPSMESAGYQTDDDRSTKGSGME